MPDGKLISIPEVDPFFGKRLIANYKDYQSPDFKSEKDLCDFIDSHAEQFAEEVLGIIYCGHCREYRIKDGLNRADFMFTAIRPILVECKNPKRKSSESLFALAKLMAYSCDEGECRMVLVTSQYDESIRKVIKKYNLPIDVYVFYKDHVMKLL